MLQVILGVIQCISDFQKHCVSKKAGLRVKDTSRSLCLALLDYVSRSHEIKISHLSSVVRVAIISEPNTLISFKEPISLLFFF